MLFIRVPYYIGDVKRDPNMENCPYTSRKLAPSYSASSLAEKWLLFFARENPKGWNLQHDLGRRCRGKGSGLGFRGLGFRV